MFSPKSSKKFKSDMDTPTFTDLPLELIERIVKHNFLDRHRLRLVCKALYDAINNVYRDNFSLPIYADDLINRRRTTEKLESLSNPLTNCLRVHQNVRIHLGNWCYKENNEESIRKEFWIFMRIHGKFFKNLAITGIDTILNGNLYENLFLHTENITHLKLTTDSSNRKGLKCLDLRNLPNLSYLRISCTYFDIKNLKVRENSLKVMEYSAYGEIGVLCKFFSTQINLISLNLDTSEFNASVSSESCLKSLKKLEHLKLYMLPYGSVYNLLNNQTLLDREFLNIMSNIKIFEVTNCMDSEAFEVLTQNMTKLEVLSMNFDKIGDAHITKIGRLKNLKKLNVRSYKIFSKNIVEIPIDSLYLDSCPADSDLNAEKMNQLLPNLKLLYVKFCDTIHAQYEAFFKNFRNLEKLRIHTTADPFSKMRQFLPEYINDCMQTLWIDEPIKFDNILSQYFPNLVELMIQVDNLKETPDIRVLFSKFNQLQRIFLRFKKTFSVDNVILESIKQKTTLKVFFLEDVSIDVKAVQNSWKIFEIAAIDEFTCIYKKRKVHNFILAKNAETLIESRLNFEEFSIVLQTYRKALNYNQTDINRFYIKHEWQPFRIESMEHFY